MYLNIDDWLIRFWQNKTSIIGILIDWDVNHEKLPIKQCQLRQAFKLLAKLSLGQITCRIMYLGWITSIKIKNLKRKRQQFTQKYWIKKLCEKLILWNELELFPEGHCSCSKYYPGSWTSMIVQNELKMVDFCLDIWRALRVMVIAKTTNKIRKCVLFELLKHS